MAEVFAIRLLDVLDALDGNGPFWNPGCQGPFAEWLWKRLGRHSSLGWAAEIEREAEASDTPAVELFFSLLDEYRAERSQPKE